MEVTNNDINLNDLKEALLNHICDEKKAFFKHQLQNEEEIDYKTKKEITSNLLTRSHSIFLSRFGMHLKKEHLKYFESQDYKDKDQQDEIAVQLKQLFYNLDHKRVLVKNRRYAAMTKLIQEKSYFSEPEMKTRDPLLWDQLIGQYLSPVEKRARRRPDPQQSTLLDVLFEGIDHDHDFEVEKKQREIEERYRDDEESSQSIADTESEPELNEPRWGNFEDDTVQQLPSTTNKSKKRSSQLITPAERDILKGEFLGIMMSNFITGKDSEFFDYSEVDNNDEYDETSENEQDFEDKYFDEESQNVESLQEKMQNDDNESEDELDIFMNHIEQHIKHQNEKAFQEEFDDE